MALRRRVFLRCNTSMDPLGIPPSISQLFRTNLVPSPMDARHIRRLSQGYRAQLATFAEEIERARAELLRLEQERDQVKDIVHELDALVSPVRRMPTDIMAKIFEHSVLDQVTPRADPRMAPLLLGQVCRAWRYLLFSLPCLWTGLQLDLPLGSKDWQDLARFKSLATQVWFSRSKALPISLSVNHPRGPHIPWGALVHLEREILTHSGRLKALSLRLSSRSLTRLLTFTQSPLPYLEHLELHNSNPLPANDYLPPIVLHSAPSLKSLSLSWCCLDLYHFQVPWAQLQHLNLDYDASSYWNPVHSDYLQTLSLCPNLTTLCLGIGAPIKDVDPAHVQPVTLAHVHTFKSNLYVQTPYLSHFFDALRMPQLRQFDVRNASLALGSFAGQTECLPFLMRCAHTLESVCFNRVDIADAVVLSCLTQLDRLKTMSFLPGILRLNHGLITALTHEDEGSRICPALETLQLRCSSVVPVDAITRLVASRCRTEPKLKWFSLQMATFEYGLDTRDDKIEQVQTRLREYVEAGLHLVLTKSRNKD